MNRKTIVLCVFLAAVLVAPAFPLMRKLSLSELVRNAEVIVTGKVVEKECRWNEKKTVIWTYVTISVDEYVKGEGEKEVVVRHLGGEVGRKGLLVGNMPRFREGEEVLVFLREAKRALLLQDGVYNVSGLAQGKYKIFADESGEKMIRNSFSNLCIQDEDGVRLLSEKTLPAKPLSEFVLEIKGAVAELARH